MTSCSREAVRQAGSERPEFSAALAALRRGDMLVFWKSDRWGRSAAHVLTTVGELRDRGVTVRSLIENFDLGTTEGRFMFAVLAAAAEYELELRAERQAEGVTAARRRQADGTMLPGKKRIGRRHGDWSPDDWSLDLAVFADGRVVGQQEISGREYRILREVSTFSWLGLRYQGQGLGTEMRAAVLHLAFAGLGAAEAVSGAFDGNAPSLRVSERLGYESDGIERLAAGGRATTTRRLRLPRARWEMSERIPVPVTGLSPCLPLFGLRDGGGS
jgi:hypothetical protein